MEKLIIFHIIIRHAWQTITNTIAGFRTAMFRIPVATAQDIMRAAELLGKEMWHPLVGSEVEDLVNEARALQDRIEAQGQSTTDESRLNQILLQLNKFVHEADYKKMKLQGTLNGVGRFGIGDAAHFLGIHPEIEELEMRNIVMNTDDYRLKFFYAALADIKKLRKMTLSNFVPTVRFFKALQSIRIEHLDIKDLTIDALEPFDLFDSWIPPFIKANPPLKKLSVFVDSIFYRFVYPLAAILEAVSLNSKLEVRPYPVSFD